MKRLLFLACGAAPCTAQQAADVATPVLSLRGPEPEVIAAGGRAEFTLRIDGVELATLGVLPAVDGIAWSAAAPVTRTAMAWSEGRATTQASIAWVISATAQRDGTFNLPAFAASVSQATFTSAPSRLEVLPAIAHEPRAFIELVAPSDTLFLQQRVTLRLRFGLERSFRADHLVPMFVRALDVAAQVRASWWDGLSQAVLLDDEPSATAGRRATFALNDRVGTATQVADEVRDGRAFEVFEITRTLLPTHTGELCVPGPGLRFAFATRFDDDFVNGRVAVEQQQGCARSERLTLSIEPWPTSAQPTAFSGAVGRFAVQADAAPRDVEVGQSFKLTLRVRGDGNVRQFAAPRLDQLAGFHLLGKVETSSATERVITYDLAAQRADAALPPVTLAFFDPTPPAGYHTATSAPIELRIAGDRPRGETPPTIPPARRVAGVDDIFDATSTNVQRGADHTLGRGVVLAALAAPWLLALVLAGWLRARERTRRDPAGHRARGAAAAFRSATAGADRDAHAALIAYLAARLRCPDAAVISPDLAARLTRAGIPAELAARTAATIDQAAASRYGGTTQSRAADHPIDLVDALEASFQSAERQP